MPINAFASRQTVQFQLVASKIEMEWNEPTFCGRLLVSDGSEVEVQATKDALEQWKKIPVGIAHAMEVTRACLKIYKGTGKTGIDSKFFVRVAFVNKSIHRSARAFPSHVLSNRALVRGPELEQKDPNAIFNVAGFVHSAGAPPAPTSSPSLPRREVDLFDGNWQMSLSLIGSLASKQLEVGAKVVVVSVKKRDYCGITSLETTRLSHIIDDAPWAIVDDKSQEGPVRKALKSESLNLVTIAAAKSLAGDVAARVKASMVPIDADLFTMNIWHGPSNDSMRLPLKLRDHTGNMFVTFWSSDFGETFGKNVADFNAMWEDCAHGDAQQASFLAALNVAAGKELSWTLRPKIWNRSDGTAEVQWSVAAVADVDGAGTAA